ncbi:MAG: hypothetical protein ACP5LQ_05290 [Candidatus Methanodesulfokora sp.]
MFIAVIMTMLFAIGVKMVEHMAHVSGEKIAIEKAMRTAASKDIRFPAHTNWLAQKRNSSLFRDHTLYSVIECIGNCCIISESVVAVGGDGSAFILPDEFNKVVRREKIEVRLEDDALKVAFEYVNSSAAIRRAFLLRNVSDMSKIHLLDNMTVKPPVVFLENNEYIVSFFIRYNLVEIPEGLFMCFEPKCDQALNGVIEYWRVKVKRDGTITVLTKNIDKRGVALKKARETAYLLEKWSPPYDIKVGERKSMLFRNHTLYSATARVECSTAVVDIGVVAVGGDGSAFILPDEFNKVVRREKIEVRSEDDALKVAFEYVNSSVAIGRALLLSNVSDIPGSSPGNCGKGWSLEECKLIYDRSKNIINKLKDIITAPNITIKHDSYVVTFFSWKDLGGIVEMWKIKVGKDGTASLLFHEVVAEEVGAYFVLR